MNNTLVDVLVELDNGETAECVAKIVKVSGDTFTVRYLSETTKKHGGGVVYDYEKTTYDIDRASIAGYYETTNESDAGFIELDKGGWVRVGSAVESDSDYVPSDEDTDTDDDSEFEYDDDENDVE
jgi:hypothetical protein